VVTTLQIASISQSNSEGSAGHLSVREIGFVVNCKISANLDTILDGGVVSSNADIDVTRAEGRRNAIGREQHVELSEYTEDKGGLGETRRVFKGNGKGHIKD
jgi:hypothetical protein